MAGTSRLTQDLLNFEAEARSRSEGLEALGKLPGPRRCPPAGFTRRHYPLLPFEQAELRRLKAAAYAATDVDTFASLCRGESVPASRLNPRTLDQHAERIARGR